MGLFRSRAKKNREQAAAALPVEQPRVTAEPVVAHRETTAEARPDPDRPGWGRALGQQIGQSRGDHAGHD